MAEHDRLLLEGRPPRAVFLPTAAGQEGDRRVDYWLGLGEEHFAGLGAEPVPLRVVDRAGAEDADLAAAVAGAGLVYLSGGNPGYLADTLRGTLVLDAILAAWQAGAALAGCSAGACALTTLAIDVLSRRPRPGLDVVPGLVVLPHFDQIQSWWPGIVEERRAALGPGQKLVGIDEDTALTTFDGNGSFTVHGLRQVWVFGPDGPPQAFSPGERIDLR